MQNSFAFSVRTLGHHTAQIFLLFFKYIHLLLSYIMKFDIFAILSVIVTLVMAQGAKQTYIIGLQKGAVVDSLSQTIEALLKLVLGVAAPGPAQQWMAGDFSGFTADLAPGEVKVLQASALVSYSYDYMLL